MASAFAKSDRLLNRADFEAVLAPRRSVGDRRMQIFFKRNELGRPRLGLVVSRAFGNAVERNRFKRRLREIFRKHRPAIGADLAVLPGRSGEARAADFAALLESWLALIPRLKQKLS